MHIEATSQEISELFRASNTELANGTLARNEVEKQFAANHRQAALCKALLEVARAIRNASSFSHPDPD